MYTPYPSLPKDPVGWRKIVEPAKDAYWQARRDAADETTALLRALDVAIAIANREQGIGMLVAEWQPIGTAPKDGTEIQAKIPGHGSDNVIAFLGGYLDSKEQECGGWTFTRDQEPPDSWTDGVCWEVNEDGEQSVKPTHWKALPPEMSSHATQE